MSTITLQSQDAQKFLVEIEVAQMSTTIRNLIMDADIENPIPLPNINGAILSKVVNYCKYHHENDANKSEKMDTDEEKKETAVEISEWDKEFCNVDQSTLFELIMGANYLENRPLLDLTCQMVADMIKGKTTEQIRTIFNIINDFTPEEEEAVRKENEWCK